MVNIKIADEEESIRRCYGVMNQLRIHLQEEEFVRRVIAQQEEGYSLAYLETHSQVEAVAGFRVCHSLSWGTFMYVDDLVTASTSRSKGYGGRLLDWLVSFARDHEYDQLHLDSGVQRHGAHRFYLRKGMDITCHHFAMKLK